MINKSNRNIGWVLLYSLFAACTGKPIPDAPIADPVTTKMGADSLHIYSKHLSFVHSDPDSAILLKIPYAQYFIRLIPMGNNKFIYMECSLNDSLPEEMGQLGMYRLGHKNYLLREGIWSMRDQDEKMLWSNDRGFTLDEMPVSLEPSIYEGTYPPDSTRPVRRAVKRSRDFSH